jgi:hypothetical protein
VAGVDGVSSCALGRVSSGVRTDGIPAAGRDQERASPSSNSILPTSRLATGASVSTFTSTTRRRASSGTRAAYRWPSQDCPATAKLSATGARSCLTRGRTSGRSQAHSLVSCPARSTATMGGPSSVRTETRPTAWP